MKNTDITREDLKKLHQKQIFLYAREGKDTGISRAELAERLKLSFPSITALVDELIEKGLLIETGSTEAKERGRPRSLLRVRSDIIYVPVFEIQREGYRFVLYDACGGIEKEAFLPFKDRKVTSGLWHPSNEELASPVTECINGEKESYRLSDILISIPGNIYSDGAFSSSAVNLRSEKNLIKFIEEKTDLAVFTLNTADALAYAERVYSDVGKNYIYINISDGIGAGIIKDGRIFKDSNRRAGEIGHMSLDLNGRPCSCGARGCLERYASIGVLLDEAKDTLNAPSVQLSFLASKLNSGNERAYDLLAKKADMIAVAINNALTLHYAESIIIGGAITELGGKFETLMQNALQTRLSKMYRSECKLKLSKNLLCDSTIGIFNEYIENVLQTEKLF